MSDCYIYMIGREEGPIKVGISSTPRARVAVLQTGCPFEIQLLHAVKCKNREHALHHEKIFHEIYSEKRLHGEWFDIDAELCCEGVDTGFQIEEYMDSPEYEQSKARHS